MIRENINEQPEPAPAVRDNRDNIYPVNLKVKSKLYDLGSEKLFNAVADELVSIYGDSYPDDDDDDTNELTENEEASLLLHEALHNKTNNDSFEYTFTTEAFITIIDGRLELSYDDTELMVSDCCRTSISFDLSCPDIITVFRSGDINTAFVLEEGKRHICIYETYNMPFEMCVYTRKIENNMTVKGGRILLDYAVELKGSTAQRSRLEIIAKG